MQILFLIKNIAKATASSHRYVDNVRHIKKRASPDARLYHLLLHVTVASWITACRIAGKYRFVQFIQQQYFHCPMLLALFDAFEYKGVINFLCSNEHHNFQNV